VKIKLEHDFGKVIISTPHNDPDKSFSPVLEIEAIAPGLEESVRGDLQREVEESHGFYGHTMKLERSTNLDLSASVRKLPSFKVLSIEPEIKPNPLPEGVQT
jgi:hypothetical protein